MKFIIIGIIIKEKNGLFETKICPKTMRPYYNIKNETLIDCLAKKLDISKT